MVLELKKLSEDEKIRQQTEARADYDSRIATAKSAGMREGYEKGKEEGKAEGIIEATIQVYNNCISRGMTREEAISISEIAEEDIPNNSLK